MTTLKTLIIAAPLLLITVTLDGQGRGVAPAELLKPLADSWPTYSGDYSGKRYSALKQINQATVKNLTLAWVAKLTEGPGPQGGFGRGGRGGGGGGGSRLIVGGLGTGEFVDGRTTTIKGSALMVDGTIYISSPDNAWALDAHTGGELWHYYWKTRGGTHIGNRGLGMWNNYLYMETPDNYLVSLEAKTGKERWYKEIADFNQQYFSTTARDGDRQSRDCWNRQRPRCAGIPPVLRSGDRRAAVEAVHGADEGRRSRARHLGEPERGAARRRSALAARLVRS